jgi:hypothetical protein
VSALLEQAFAALGTTPTWEERKLVAAALRESGDAEALELLQWRNIDALAELAERSGSSWIIASDMPAMVANPSWSLRRCGE